MSVFLAFVIFALSMAACLISGASMLIALSAGLVAFAIAAHSAGHSYSSIAKMAWRGAKRAFVVIRVLLLIGLITALWRSAGVISFFVYYGVKLITPHMFILITFVLSSIVSYAIGTSFGVCGTVGVIMMTIARAGGVSPLAAAGAVMRGAYFGDRCSPASSCANLVACVTETELYSNIRAMLRSGLVPTAITLLGFAAISYFNPSSETSAPMLTALAESFALPFYVVIPALIMLVLPVLKVDVRIAMGSSIASAFLLTIFVQGGGFLETLVACFSGYAPKSAALAETLSGGGISSMLNVIGIVLLSSSYSGIFDETGMLHSVNERLSSLANKTGLYGATLIAGTASVMAFCNQTIATIMANQLLKGAYEVHGASNADLALDISDSLVLTSGMVPWAIACSVPLATLGVDARALPFCLLLYITPLYRLAKAGLARARKAHSA